MNLLYYPIFVYEKNESKQVIVPLIVAIDTTYEFVVDVT